MARVAGLAGDPEILSGGPRERSWSPRWSKFRFVALGMIAVALGAVGGYRSGVVHSRQPHAAHDISHRTEALPIQGHPSGAGFGDGSVWITVVPTTGGSPGSLTGHAAGYVARYDPTTRRLEATVPVGNRPLAVRTGYGSMWVTNSGDGTVTRIDPRRNKVVSTIRVGPIPDQIAPADGGMWVATQDAAVKIDPLTDTVVAKVTYPHWETSTSGKRALDADSHGVWISTAIGTVLRLRPSDGRLLATIPVKAVPVSQPGKVAIDGDNVWVSDYAVERPPGHGPGSDAYGPSDHLVDISATSDKILRRVSTEGYSVDSFLLRHRTLLIVGNDWQDNSSELIRTDWPFQTVVYARPLDANSCDVVDTHGYLWIPSWSDRVVQVLPDMNASTNSSPDRR